MTKGNYESATPLFYIYMKCFFWQGNQEEKEEYIKSLNLTKEQNKWLQGLANGISNAWCNQLPRYPEGGMHKGGMAVVGEKGKEERIKKVGEYILNEGLIQLKNSPTLWNHSSDSKPISKEEFEAGIPKMISRLAMNDWAYPLMDEMKSFQEEFVDEAMRKIEDARKKAESEFGEPAIVVSLETKYNTDNFSYTYEAKFGRKSVYDKFKIDGVNVFNKDVPDMNAGEMIDTNEVRWNDEDMRNASRYGYRMEGCFHDDQFDEWLSKYKTDHGTK